ncbi:LytR/AlgR family response regulator transcription factor [Desertivirga xinjiangensis]|uniref:LytR/AlgR family response regulator transcription factor n=1 Tax=Desertivirga xinjiangensis TaxID=539206 RepID=UPI002109DE8C|nr:response regulator transcription factor [Pedobacter xinjiangensis]
MKPITCYILDDDPESISILKHYIEKLSWLKIIGFSTTPLEALETINKGLTADITFLDVEMPDFSGFEIARLLTNKSAIIFTTAHSKYAAEAWYYDGTDFLEKPFSYERFTKAVLKIRNKMEKEDELDRLREENGSGGSGLMDQQAAYQLKNGAESSETSGPKSFYTRKHSLRKRFQYDSLVYIQGQQNYKLMVFIDGRKTIFYASMQNIMKSLPKNFLRIQKSYIINVDYIKSVDKLSVVMENDKRINIGDSYKAKLYESIDFKTIGLNRKK